MLALALVAAARPGARAPQSAPPGQIAGGHVDVIRVADAITPITVEQISTQLDRSSSGGAKALVLVMDTPGGLEASMRDIVKMILASRVPVITYVAPPGARAASAGLFIVTASHVAAMAPNTNLGAASPVSLGGAQDSTMARKAMSDAAALIRSLAETRGRNADWNARAVTEAISASATEAVTLRVVDFIAPDLADVMRQANGRRVVVAGDTIRLDLAGAEVREVAPTMRHRILSWIVNPNVAYLLLTLGFYGILFELQSPGSVLPGVAGAILIILGLVAMQTLPVNVAGALLILLAITFFIVEIKVQSHGVLAAGGVVAFFFGSLILFEPGPGQVFRVSPAVIAGTTLATAALFIFVIGKALGVQKRRVTTGAEGLVGAVGDVVTDVAPQGDVRVHGELWRARSAAGPIAAGSRVEVTGVDGLTLIVRARTQSGD
jgi:membrane-bound serine protease (ClpP class)